jgi:hypothetical protein
VFHVDVRACSVLNVRVQPQILKLNAFSDQVASFLSRVDARVTRRRARAQSFERT